MACPLHLGGALAPPRCLCTLSSGSGERFGWEGSGGTNPASPRGAGSGGGGSGGLIPTSSPSSAPAVPLQASPLCQRVPGLSGHTGTLHLKPQGKGFSLAHVGHHSACKSCPPSSPSLTSGEGTAQVLGRGSVLQLSHRSPHGPLGSCGTQTGDRPQMSPVPKCSSSIS